MLACSLGWQTRDRFTGRKGNRLVDDMQRASRSRQTEDAVLNVLNSDRQRERERAWQTCPGRVRSAWHRVFIFARIFPQDTSGVAEEHCLWGGGSPRRVGPIKSTAEFGIG